MNGSRRAAVELVSRLVTGSGVARLTRELRRARGDHRLWILEYHDVGVEREGSVSAHRFAIHLSNLDQTGYRFSTLAAAMRALDAPGGLDADRVVVTFDDGYAGTFRHAWPALRTAGVPATVFVTTGFLDGAPLWFDVARRALAAALERTDQINPALRTQLAAAFADWPRNRSSAAIPSQVESWVGQLKYWPPEQRRELLTALEAADLPLPPAAQPMLWEEARELHAAGIEIGCHTVNHPILSRLSAEEQRAEIVEARDRIHAELGVAPTSFAYPNGSARDFDATTVAALRAAGFTAACTTLRGSNKAGSDPWTLHRIGIGADSTAVLAARLAGLFDEDRPWRRRARTAGLGSTLREAL